MNKRSLVRSVSLVGGITLATGLMYVKRTYYEVAPGEEGLDRRSFFFAKTAFLLLPPAEKEENIVKGRKLYDYFLLMFQKWDYFWDPSLRSMVYNEVDIPVPVKYEDESEEEGKKQPVLISIPARIYYPDAESSSSSSKALKPVMIWYHGGGWRKGSMAGDHSLCQQIQRDRYDRGQCRLSLSS